MIMVIGGAGYTGSVLVKELLDRDHQVKVIDTMWFGNYLEGHPNLSTKITPYKDLEPEDFKEVNEVIHLANIANDPSVDLAPTLSWEINVLHLKLLLDMCKKSGVSKFIYASSGSVYGIKQEAQVTEELDLVPISVYNKTKMVAERVIRSYSNEFETYSIRPATVCGPSPRMRFDVLVNMFVKQAKLEKRIQVLGGTQIRPHIHILDLARVYIHFLDGQYESGEYNAGFENISVEEVASIVRKYENTEISIFESNDPRSYRLDSTKLIRTGFQPKKKVSDAIEEIIHALDSGLLKDNPRWYTVSWMKQLDLGLNHG